MPETIVAGHYEIVRGIGRGSFGRTFLARDRGRDLQVAIKVLDQRAGVDLKAIELFEREAAVLRSMRHQGIPEVHDLVRDQWEGVSAAFLVMEYVEGTSLLEVIESQRQLDPAEVMHVFLEMLGILEYLHSRVPPIVHRDIKPSNVILRPDGRPALVDFGSVRRVFLGADEAGSTIVGTYGYMPYEQYMGQATPSSDLYSLAATLLHLLTGRAPREFLTDEGRIAVPESLPGDSRLRPIIARLLRPSPTERFASARDVRQALLTPSSALRAASDHPMPPRTAQLAVRLPDAPRPLSGETKQLFDRIAPGALELMASESKPADGASLLDWAALVLFSVMTVGVLPIVFLSMARQRRQRLRRFLANGVQTTARILSIVDEETAFKAKIAKVAYEFEVDGATRRDVDKILPIIANRWQPGDAVQILYLTDADYDSVIISSS